ncbi:hypothetical protein KGO04_04420 [Patescibacteria group bacterium]|nr:hypothetical protein [Patescibacteria group bacterium]
MFITFLREVVCAAFHAGAQVFLVRRFGFDLVNGSEVFAREEGLLEEHDFLVQRYIKDWGLIPPLYVVTERITPWLRAQLDKYFKDGSGQRYIEIPYHWDREKKVRAIVSIVRDELEGRPPELLAA